MRGRLLHRATNRVALIEVPSAKPRGSVTGWKYVRDGGVAERSRTRCVERMDLSAADFSPVVWTHPLEARHARPARDRVDRRRRPAGGHAGRARVVRGSRRRSRAAPVTREVPSVVCRAAPIRGRRAHRRRGARRVRRAVLHDDDAPRARCGRDGGGQCAQPLGRSARGRAGDRARHPRGRGRQHRLGAARQVRRGRRPRQAPSRITGQAAEGQILASARRPCANRAMS